MPLMPDYIADAATLMMPSCAIAAMMLLDAIISITLRCLRYAILPALIFRLLLIYGRAGYMAENSQHGIAVSLATCRYADDIAADFVFAATLMRCARHCRHCFFAVIAILRRLLIQPITMPLPAACTAPADACRCRCHYCTMPILPLRHSTDY